MSSDELEILLLRYLDGDLSVSDRQIVETTLRDDPRAQPILAEHQRLARHLGQLESLPNIRWDRFQQRISTAVAAERMRARSLLYRWLAAAAVLLIACGLSWQVARHHPASPAAAPVSIGRAVVIGPQIQLAAGPASAKVTLGQPPLTASASPAAEDLVVQPSHAEITGVR